MKKRQVNRLRMVGVTIEFCEKNSSAWSGIPEFGNVLNAVKLKKKEIEKLIEVAEARTKGVTSDVLEKKARMIERTVYCGQRVLAFATAQGNHQLAEEVSARAYQLGRMRKEKVMARCQNIKNATANNLGAMAGYGLALSDVNDLQAAIDAYRLENPRPRLAIGNKKTARKHMDVLMREVLDNLLALRLDAIAVTLKLSNAEFWNGYHAARNILDLGIVHTKVTGRVSDEDGAWLGGVRFTVLDRETQKEVRSAVSNEEGIFRVMRMAVGTFDFKWELAGFVTKEEKAVHMAAGKRLRRRVRMRRGS